MRYGAEAFALGAEVKPESLLEAMRTLRDTHGYRFYITGTAIDRDEEIEVLHGVRNLEAGDEIFVKVRLPRQVPEIETAAFQFAGAEWHEREVLDLFGVTFRSHPDPRRILMPDEYTDYPLRKEFPLYRG